VLVNPLGGRGVISQRFGVFSAEKRNEDLYKNDTAETEITEGRTQ
jgi:hypothetical protein